MGKQKTAAAGRGQEKGLDVGAKCKELGREAETVPLIGIVIRLRELWEASGRDSRIGGALSLCDEAFMIAASVGRVLNHVAEDMRREAAGLPHDGVIERNPPDRDPEDRSGVCDVCGRQVGRLLSGDAFNPGEKMCEDCDHAAQALAWEDEDYEYEREIRADARRRYLLGIRERARRMGVPIMETAESMASDAAPVEA